MYLDSRIYVNENEKGILLLPAKLEKELSIQTSLDEFLAYISQYLNSTNYRVQTEVPIGDPSPKMPPPPYVPPRRTPRIRKPPIPPGREYPPRDKPNSPKIPPIWITNDGAILH